eukprot:1141416-Pelagomonas_calceolata.AAC.3
MNAMQISIVDSKDLKGVLRGLTAEDADAGKFVPIAALECRGLEPIGYAPEVNILTSSHPDAVLVTANFEHVAPSFWPRSLYGLTMRGDKEYLCVPYNDHNSSTTMLKKEESSQVSAHCMVPMSFSGCWCRRAAQTLALVSGA